MAFQQQTMPVDVVIQGALTVQGAFNPPAGSVGNAAVAAVAGIAASKLQQQYEPTYRQTSTTTAAVDRQVIHVVRGATGTILAVAFAAVTANIGAATVVFDLLKNGVSILSAQLTLDNGTAAFILKAGALSSSAVVAGDVIELQVVSATAGGGTIAKGVFARLTLNEDPN